MTARVLRLAMPFAALLLAGGCGMIFGDDGVFRDRSEDYKQAPELPVLDVPEDKDSAALQEIYVVPPVEEGVVLQGEFEVPRPTPLVAGAGGADTVRIQRLGDESWALVELAPGQVWPQVRNFIAAAGMQVARADARAGIIETAWLAIEDKPLASRFRFRMEQGVQRGTSELHVLQMNQAVNSDEWPERSDDSQQAQEMLRAVAQYLADSADSTPVSMVAEQGIRSGGKISLRESPEGNTYIRLELPYYRAWASLARALQESTFEITDRNRSAGIYYARFNGPEEEDGGGWFDWLWGEDGHPLAGQMFLVSITELEKGVVSIELQPQDDTPDFDKRQEQGLLELIKGNID
ncbi:MAG: outer membrane protein assembly factor BamC [Halioglobus sp.]|nr:outer membrane protein assembly factor BamC [Halioglobus sp.]